MKAEKLTALRVKGLRADPDGEYSLGDQLCRGLRLRVTAKGVKTFAFAYRSKLTGKVAQLTIGRFPDVSLDAARTAADAARAAVARGEDPQAAKITRRAEKKSAALTYSDLLDDYGAKHLASKRTRKRIERQLRRVGNAYGWNDKPAASITHDDAVKLMDAIRHGGDRETPQAAKTTCAMLNTMFGWALFRRTVPANPFAGMNRALGIPLAERDRNLSNDEIAAVWDALDDPTLATPDVATALRLILATGQRSGQVIGMVSSELDLDGAKNQRGPLWDLPGERMKMGCPFVLPLSALAVDLIRPYADNAAPGAPLLRNTEGGPLYGLALQQATARTAEHLGIPHFTPHDLRRSATTLIVRTSDDRYSEVDTDLLLSHQSTKGPYVVRGVWGFFTRKRELADYLATALTRIIAPSAPLRLVA